MPFANPYADPATFRAAFVVRYPEFQYVSTTQIEACLGEALADTSDAWEGVSQAEEYVMVKAAEKLSESPVGRDARVTEPGQAKTTYMHHRLRLEKAFAFARSRTGVAEGDVAQVSAYLYGWCGC